MRLMSMNTAMDNLIALLTVVGILVAVTFPSLLGIAHDRRVDRQIRTAHRLMASTPRR
jgi:type II secretory pathway pseudopilin PulG